ncbi:DUF1799 domain-containing protein [Paracidovorax avenae]|uniref:DUF1799 domain-containing protein n=1 Tax=Paracidovorax avenae TaxID=80867 RepID=UPI002285BAE5|nr:DUF1799 domain-containing protein [Paracidovorax avenae]
MAFWGLTPDDYGHEEVWVWPENADAFFLFRDLATQWRVAMGGPTGLDHNVLLLRLDRMRLADDDRDQLDADVRVMELAALEQMNEEREKRERTAK